MAFIYFRTFWFGGHLCVKDFFVSGHLLSGHLVVEANFLFSMLKKHRREIVFNDGSDEKPF